MTSHRTGIVWYQIIFPNELSASLCLPVLWRTSKLNVPFRVEFYLGDSLFWKEIYIIIWILETDIDIFVKWNWVDTRWQQYSTHWHTTVHRTTQLTTLVGRLSGIRTQSGQTKIIDYLLATIFWIEPFRPTNFFFSNPEKNNNSRRKNTDMWHWHQEAIGRQCSYSQYQMWGSKCETCTCAGKALSEPCITLQQ